MHYTYSDQKQQMGIAPIIPVAVAALPAVSKIFSSIFGSKKKKVTPPPPPPKPAVPQWVWIAGVATVAVVGTTLVVSMGRRRRR